MTFPAEAVPDGDIFAPHHLYIGLAITLFGFMFAWANYPKLGASITAAGIAIQADDYVSHAFGIWTPLDAVWEQWLRPVIGR